MTAAERVLAILLAVAGVTIAILLDSDRFVIALDFILAGALICLAATAPSRPR